MWSSPTRNVDEIINASRAIYGEKRSARARSGKKNITDRCAILKSRCFRSKMWCWMNFTTLSKAFLINSGQINQVTMAHSSSASSGRWQLESFPKNISVKLKSVWFWIQHANVLTESRYAHTINVSENRRSLHFVSNKKIRWECYRRRRCRRRHCRHCRCRRFNNAKSSPK